MMQYNDLTFFTNEPDRDLYGRFSNILKSNTQFFDIKIPNELFSNLEEKGRDLRGIDR